MKSIAIFVATITLAVGGAHADERPKLTVALPLVPPPSWATRSNARETANDLRSFGIVVTSIGAALLVATVSFMAANLGEAIIPSSCHFVGNDGGPTTCDYAPAHGTAIGLAVGSAVPLAIGIPLLIEGQYRHSWLARHHAELKLTTSTSSRDGATSVTLGAKF
jgi:hypothetical protein